MIPEVTEEEQAAIDAQKRHEAETAERRKRIVPQPVPAAEHHQIPLTVRHRLHTRVLRFLMVVTGPKVDGRTWRERMAACQRCPKREDVQYRHGVKTYCGACGCPRWRFSQLQRANRYELWTCNLGRHPGQNNAPGGCAGCGGG